MRFPAQGLARSLVVLGACALAGLLAGWLAGAAGWGLAAGLGLWVAREATQARLLEAWMEDTSSKPQLRGFWADIHAEMNRRRRRARKRRDRLMRRLRRFQQITEALPDAVVLCSPDGDMEWFNSAAQRVLNLSAADVGNNLAGLLRVPAVAQLFEPGVEDGLLELDSPFAPGVTLELRMFPDETGNRVVLVRDTTDVRRLLTMRQDFVANVSHELRTPLTVAVGYLEALEEPDGMDAAMMVRLGERMRPPILRMKALVDDLLLLSRLEAGPAAERPDEPPVDVPATLRGVVADAHQVSAGQHVLVLDADNSLLLDGQPMELHSACDNLVMNAVRYSPDGGEVRITWQATDDGGALLAVHDQGIGIPPEHIDRLTERFYRVDLGRSRVRGGTGLGLAIVKHVLRRHDATLQVESTLGKGSSFSCTFPPERVRRRTAAAASGDSAATGTTAP